MNLTKKTKIGLSVAAAVVVLAAAPFVIYLKNFCLRQFQISM